MAAPSRPRKPGTEVYYLYQQSPGYWIVTKAVIVSYEEGGSTRTGDYTLRATSGMWTGQHFRAMTIDVFGKRADAEAEAENRRVQKRVA